jgi:hypothetical protein
MRNDSIKRFVTLRQQLAEERTTLEVRLREINDALGQITGAAVSAIPARSGGGRRGRKGSGGSLREHVMAVVQGGPKTKEELLAAVQARGYKFSTRNPLNSLGVILYGKNPRFNRADGKFSLGAVGGAVTSLAKTGRRQMSAAGRARIAAAQRARWAKQKGRSAPTASAKGAKPRRMMSSAARKAISAAARKRWAVAKAAGRMRL